MIRENQKECTLISLMQSKKNAQKYSNNKKKICAYEKMCIKKYA